MIAYLKGTVILKTEKYIILETASVGYRVFISPILNETLKLRQPIELFTHQYTTEEAIELYGFQTSEELDFFERLIAISGVGPKTALNVLSMSPVQEIQKAILQDDATVLTRVSGIGRKTAERIIVELKGALEKTGLTAGAGDQNFLDALEALVQLGYARAEARRALAQLPQKISDPQERVKAALKILGKK